MAKEETDEVYNKRIRLIYSTIKNLQNREFVKKILDLNERGKKGVRF
jgi:hypothetical protein